MALAGFCISTMAESTPWAGGTKALWRRMEYCMLDCPAAIHTSPTTTLVYSMVSRRPFMVSVRGVADAAMGFSVTSHELSAAARVLVFCFPKVTVMRSPGAALPHTGTGRPCWSTMSDDSMDGVLIRACAAAAATMAAMIANNVLFIVCVVWLVVVPGPPHAVVRQARRAAGALRQGRRLAFFTCLPCLQRPSTLCSLCSGPPHWQPVWCICARCPPQGSLCLRSLRAAVCRRLSRKCRRPHGI